jgi:hypothetical protein
MSRAANAGCIIGAALATAALVCGACWRSPPSAAAATPVAATPVPAAPPAPPPAPAPAPAPARPQTPALAVPRIHGPLKIDAELDGKKAWEAEAGDTQNFKDDAGAGMVPYTEAKARWGDGKLYLLLYAGDLDLQGTVRKHDGPVERDDAFRLELGAGDEVRTLSVSVLGTVADALCRRTPTGRACDSTWESHAQVAVDRDGTLNKIGDNDEEWVVEMAIPMTALGLPHAGPGTRVPLAIRRCEVGHGYGRQHCGGWGGELVLGP